MIRERQHSHGIDRTTVATDSERAGEVEGWPGKQPLTMDLGTPGPGMATATHHEVLRSESHRDPDLDAVDRRVGELSRPASAPGDDDDQALWIAQQQRPARWKQVVAWAGAHRALRSTR